MHILGGRGANTGAEHFGSALQIDRENPFSVNTDWGIDPEGERETLKGEMEKERREDLLLIPDSNRMKLCAHTHGRDETTSRLGCSVLADPLPPNLRFCSKGPSAPGTAGECFAS